MHALDSIWKHSLSSVAYCGQEDCALEWGGEERLERDLRHGTIER